MEFKKQADELLSKRFSLEFYVGRISAVIGGVDDPEKLEKEIRKTILRKQPNNIRDYLVNKVSDPKNFRHNSRNYRSRH